MSDDEATPSRTEFTELEREAASLLGRSLDEAASWLEKAESELLSKYGSDVEQWKQLLRAEYGCWCGPGNRCTEDKDAMDSCCHTHDSAYTALNLDSNKMWTAAAFVATRAADRALIECVNAAPREGETDEASIYRALLLEIFNKRLEVGDLLASLGA
jgi:hypothetical protein